jgi:predicted O-methyltransferase YrrM
MATTQTQKLRHLVPLLVREPREFYDRIRTKLETHADRRQQGAPFSYVPLAYEDALVALGRELGVDASAVMREAGSAAIRDHVAAARATLPDRGPFTSVHNGDVALASIVYLVARTTAPAVVVETGVAYGVTSAFVLQALAANGDGRLWSVDLPPLGADAQSHVGSLVPDHLRDRWNLRRGVSRRLLPGILERAKSIDLFIHDSLHTHSNMLWEFETAWPHLRPGGWLIADDIEGNAAFGEFADRVDCSMSLVIQEEGKRAMLGVLRKSVPRVLPSRRA